MAKVRPVSNAVLLQDGLQAGFLLSRRHSKKEYVAFSVEQIECSGVRATVGRDCTRAEKRKLAKMVYAELSVRSVRADTIDGFECMLFVTK